MSGEVCPRCGRTVWRRAWVLDHGGGYVRVRKAEYDLWVEEDGTVYRSINLSFDDE